MKDLINHFLKGMIFIGVWLLINTFVVFYLFLNSTGTTHTKVIYKTDTIYVHVDEEIRFDTMQVSIENMQKVCDSLNIKYPNIVIAQAILESGNFTSNLFIKNNNPLGLYDSFNNRYYKFDHWSEAIVAYRDKVEYKHRKNENYYDFLVRIGYAEDKNYINLIKKIQKQYELH